MITCRISVFSEYLSVINHNILSSLVNVLKNLTQNIHSILRERGHPRQLNIHNYKKSQYIYLVHILFNNILFVFYLTAIFIKVLLWNIVSLLLFLLYACVMFLLGD